MKLSIEVSADQTRLVLKNKVEKQCVFEADRLSTALFENLEDMVPVSKRQEINEVSVSCTKQTSQMSCRVAKAAAAALKAA